MQGDERALEGGVADADEFKADVFCKFDFFIKSCGHEFVWKDDVFVFEDGFQDLQGVGASDDWHSVFCCEVLDCADVVKVCVSEDDRFDFVFPVFNNAIIRDCAYFDELLRRGHIFFSCVVLLL